MNSSQNSAQASKLDLTESGTLKTSKENTHVQHKHKKTRKKQRTNSTKIRVKLPPIESYQKELEFQADGPGRVFVRLERLMGTDKIRITDAKYMSTLLERLEKEENEAWLKRTRDRKQAERNRFRQLAVEGLMDPTPDMEDLYNHPVFRVNRILNRLTKLDMDATINPNKKLPPITLVEPFADGSSGRTRYAFDPSFVGLHRDYDDVDDYQEAETKEEETEEEGDERFSLSMASNVMNEDEDREDDVEWGGEDYGGASREGNDSLAEAKLRYGIPASTNIEKKCKPFRSKLVDLVFDDNLGGADRMYDAAKELLGAYKRETLTADDFVIKLNKML